MCYELCVMGWAGSSKKNSFGVFQIDCFPDKKYDQLKQSTVPESLAVVLESCRVYPPALARAAREVDALEGCSREEFIRELEKRIREELEQQRNRPYVLARSRVSEPGYRDEGEFVWVVAYRPEFKGREVTWVSGDYQIYSDAVSTFELEPAWLEAHFNQTA